MTRAEVMLALIVVENLGVMFLPVKAVRWVDDEPIPGIVEVVFTDAEGADRVLIDKCVVFDDSLTRYAAYPVDLEMPVEVLQARIRQDGEVSAIRLPWGLGDDPVEVRSSVLIDRP